MSPVRDRHARRPLRARRRLRAGLVQLLCAAVGLVAGLTVPSVGIGPAVDGGRLVEPLVTLGVGVIGVVSLVYSLLFGVVQWSAGAFSPRLHLFRGDPLVWRTFAFAIGVFVFCAVAAMTGAGLAQVTVLVPVAAILGVLTAVGLIRRLQTRALMSIQLAHVLDAVAVQGRRVIDQRYPPGSAADEDDEDDEDDGSGAGCPTPARTVVWAGRAGVVQQLDLRRLVEAATRADAVVVFRVAVGDTVHERSPLASVRGGARRDGVPDGVSDDVSDDLVRRAVVRGLERSFDQDPMFAFRLLADIGLRALSPAVNDPATAVDALDTTDGLLRQLAVRDLTASTVRDGAGTVRVRLVVPSWEDYVRTGVTDLLPVAAASPMVLHRMLHLLDHLLEVALPDHRPALARVRDDVRSLLAGPERQAAG